MKVKRYRASTMPEAMKRIRNELGNNAIILNSRVIQTNGFLGFFKKSSIEVIAALDDKPVGQMAANKRKDIEPPLPPIQTQVENHTNDKEEQETEELRKEIFELKQLLSNVVERNDKEEASLPTSIQYLRQLLLKQEISENVVATIVNDSLKWWQEAGKDKSVADIQLWAKEYMKRKISHLPFSGISFTRKFITVVGPTGVGKTTTLAKMAADCILKYKKKVAFITTDTYRIAAIDQLKTYANILNVPIEVCYNLKDFQQAITKFEDYDLVFIDTAGRNFRNPVYVADLKKLIDFNKEMELFLVLSLTSKQIDMEEICHQFNTVKVDKIIFTKADETSTYGAMFNIMYSLQKPVAYITNGQSVPDDIISATPEKVVELLIGVN
jgi:flagellar biosynthesis protein FlhF